MIDFIMIKELNNILNCIKNSETILGGEYYVIHSDHIIALEYEINKIMKNFHENKNV